MGGIKLIYFFQLAFGGALQNYLSDRSYDIKLFINRVNGCCRRLAFGIIVRKNRKNLFERYAKKRLRIEFLTR